MDERQKIYRLLLDQMADILHQVQEADPNQLEGPVSADIQKRLDEIESAIKRFSSVHEKVVEKSGLSEQEIKKIVIGKDPTIAKPDQNLLSYAEKLEKDAKQMQRFIAKKKEEAQKKGLIGKEEHTGKKKRKKRKKTSRTKKFKKLGGDEGWIPL